MLLTYRIAAQQEGRLKYPMATSLIPQGDRERSWALMERPFSWATALHDEGCSVTFACLMQDQLQE
jgi:hypothetical protein